MPLFTLLVLLFTTVFPTTFAEDCSCYGNGCVCSIGPAPEKNQNSPYREWTPEENVDRNTCWVEIKPKVKAAQETCSSYKMRERCRASETCLWLDARAQCWGQQFEACTSVLRSLCWSIRFVEKLPDAETARIRYKCDPTASGKIITTAK